MPDSPQNKRTHGGNRNDPAASVAYTLFLKKILLFTLEISLLL